MCVYKIHLYRGVEGEGGDITSTSCALTNWQTCTGVGERGAALSLAESPPPLSLPLSPPSSLPHTPRTYLPKAHRPLESWHYSNIPHTFLFYPHPLNFIEGGGCFNPPPSQYMELGLDLNIHIPPALIFCTLQWNYFRKKYLTGEGGGVPVQSSLDKIL